MKKDPFHNSTVFWDTASVFVHHYLPDIRKVSPNTVIAYRDSLNFFIDYLDTEQNIKRKDISYNDFSKATIRTYMDWMLNVRKLSPKTCNLRVTAINSFLKYSTDQYPSLMAIYVAVSSLDMVKNRKKPIEFFERKQMKALLDAPDPKTRTGRRNQMILILLYDTAARVAELLELTLDNLHLNSDVPYVVLHGKGDKYRNVPLLEKTKKHLLAYLREFHTDSDKKEPLFYATMNGQKHSLSSDTLENLIKSSAKAACNKGIEMPTRCHCHMIRKTRAMDLYQSGVPLTHIQQLLGHEDIFTTSGFYAFATLDTLSASMAKVDASTKDEKLWKDPKAMKRLYRL